MVGGVLMVCVVDGLSVDIVVSVLRLLMICWCDMCMFVLLLLFFNRCFVSEIVCCVLCCLCESG